MNNPFDVLPIDRTKESVKIWDIAGFDSETNEGRIRILAVVPKRPNPLDDIRVAVCWCAPVDLKRFSKKRSNQILVGRWLKEFTGDKQGTVYNNAATLSVDSLVDFPSEVFKVVAVPRWAVYMEEYQERIKR